MDDRGRVVLPAAARKRLRLEPGVEFLVLPDPRGGLRLVPRDEAARGMLGAAAGSGQGSAVEELLDERRREADQETATPSRTRRR